MLFRVYTRVTGKKKKISFTAKIQTEYKQTNKHTHQWHKSWQQKGTVTTVLPTVANKTAENWFLDEQLQRSPCCSQGCRPKSHASSTWTSPVSCSVSLMYIFQSSSCSFTWVNTCDSGSRDIWLVYIGKSAWREYNRKVCVLCPPSVAIFYVPWEHWSKI